MKVLHTHIHTHILFFCFLPFCIFVTNVSDHQTIFSKRQSEWGKHYKATRATWVWKAENQSWFQDGPSRLTDHGLPKAPASVLLDMCRLHLKARKPASLNAFCHEEWSNIQERVHVYQRINICRHLTCGCTYSYSLCQRPFWAQSSLLQEVMELHCSFTSIKWTLTVTPPIISQFQNEFKQRSLSI